MKQTLENIKTAAIAELEAEGADIEAIRVRYLGKKGEITSMMKQMGSIPAEERPAFGQLVNAARKEAEDDRT